MTTRISRRSMLAGLGLAAATPWLPVLDAQAEAGDLPKRLILFYHPFGTVRSNWWPEVNGTSDFSFAGKSISEPLEAIKEHLVLLDGVRLAWKNSATTGPDGKKHSPGEQHQKGMGGLWTGSRLLHAWETTSVSSIGGQDGVIGRASGTSVDQHIIERLAPDTAFSSLHFGADIKNDDVRSRMIYTGSDKPLTPLTDPTQAWETIFEPFSGDLVDLTREREHRRSVYDVVGSQMSRVRSKLGAADVQRAEAHLDALDALRQRLSLEASCEGVDAPAVPEQSQHQVLPQVSRLQIDLMVNALSCDLTRFASMQIKDEHGGGTGWLGETSTSFHSLSHSGGSGPLIQQAYRNFNELFVYLIQQLAAIPEGDGTMLDNTLVCWGSAVGHGSHTAGPIPFVLAGGGLNTQRVLEFDEIDHQRLLVSLCHAMGCDDVESFGNLDQGSGPVPGLL